MNEKEKNRTGIPKAVTFISKGFHDVIWCPYLNEPTFLKYTDNEPDCDMCNKNYEVETHPFIAHILKPYSFLEKENSGK